MDTIPTMQEDKENIKEESKKAKEMVEKKRKADEEAAAKAGKEAQDPSGIGVPVQREREHSRSPRGGNKDTEVSRQFRELQAGALRDGMLTT